MIESLETICYDLRSFFKQSPLLLTCPSCGAPLKARHIQPSPDAQEFVLQASIPMIDTCLIICTACPWWAVRELRADCELGDGNIDYLVVPVNLSTAKNSKNTNAWKSVINDQSRWRNPQFLTAEKAIHLFGKQEVRTKQYQRISHQIRLGKTS